MNALSIVHAGEKLTFVDFLIGKNTSTCHLEEFGVIFISSATPDEPLIIVSHKIGLDLNVLLLLFALIG